MSKKIAFDLGGVLYSNGTKIAYNTLVKKGVNKDIIKYTMSSNASWDLRRGKITNDYFWNIIREKDPTNWKIINSVWHNSYHLNNNMLSYVNFLKTKDIDLGIWSDTTESRYNYLESNRVNPLFDDKVLSFEEGFVKTDEEFTEILINRMDSDPRDIILIDDSFQETEIPRDYGINVVNFDGNLTNLMIDVNKLLPIPKLFFNLGQSQKMWTQVLQNDDKRIKFKKELEELWIDLSKRIYQVSNSNWINSFNQTMSQYYKGILKERMIVKKGNCNLTEYQEIRPQTIMITMLISLMTIESNISLQEINYEIRLAGIIAGIDNDLFSEIKDENDCNPINILSVMRNSSLDKKENLKMIIKYRNMLIMKIEKKKDSYKETNNDLYQTLTQILLLIEGNFHYLSTAKRWDNLADYKISRDYLDTSDYNIYYPEIGYSIDQNKIDIELNQKSLKWCQKLNVNKDIKKILENVNAGLATKYLYPNYYQNNIVNQIYSDIILWLFIVDDYLESSSDILNYTVKKF